jgi:hypothetical protein
LETPSNSPTLPAGLEVELPDTHLKPNNRHRIGRLLDNIFSSISQTLICVPILIIRSSLIK